MHLIQEIAKLILKIVKVIACIDNFFGSVFSRILPPRNLYHPVLPYHANKKLLFPLCGLCAQYSQQEHCEHNEEDRCLECTWVSLEIKTALENGYQIKKVFGIWHWTRTQQYNPLTKLGGLFTSYVNSMLKIKQDASGYPALNEWLNLKWRKIDVYKIIMTKKISN